MLEMWLKFSVGGLVAPPPLRGEVAATMEPNMILARDQVGGSNDPPPLGATAGPWILVCSMGRLKRRQPLKAKWLGSTVKNGVPGIR